MEDERFWALVDEAVDRETVHAGSPVVAGEALVDVLAERLRPDEVVEFAGYADVVADRAGTWDLLAACRLVDGWHSDDAFRDFQDFLLLAGRAVFDRAVDDADSLAAQAALVRGRRDGRLAPGPVDDLARRAWARLTGDDDEDDWFEAVSAADRATDDRSGTGLRGTRWDSLAESETRLPALLSLLGSR